MRTRSCLPLLLLVLSACSPTTSSTWPGYAVGDALYIASPLAGRITQMQVSEGQTVVEGAPLFSTDAAPEQDALAESTARARSAEAQAQDAAKGRRREELDVTRAQLRQAEAAAQLAHSDLARRLALHAQGFVAQSNVDDAESAERQAVAHVAELRASLQSAELPARVDARRSAAALAEAASSARAQDDWRLAQTRQTAPQAGLVQTLYFRQGEWVNAGQAVLALLPPSQRKARFYVTEAQLGALKLGQSVQLTCDGCGAAIAARISYLSPQAEYTPPVIYSNADRAKLLFMIEARPDSETDALRLHPGQPLDVRPAP